MGAGVATAVQLRITLRLELVPVTILNAWKYLIARPPGPVSTPPTSPPLPSGLNPYVAAPAELIARLTASMATIPSAAPRYFMLYPTSVSLPLSHRCFLPDPERCFLA